MAPLSWTSLLLLLFWGAAAPAQPAKRPISYLHGVLLDRAPLVVWARLAKGAAPLSGLGNLVRFQVEEVLKGHAPTSLLVGGLGQRARAFPQLDKLLFLKPLASGQVCRLVDLIDLVPSEAQARLQLVRFYLQLEHVSESPSRARRLKRHAVGDLRSKAEFVRRVALRELGRLIRLRPALFTAHDLRLLVEAPPPRRAREKKLWSRSLAILTAHLVGDLGGLEKSFPSRQARAALWENLARLRRMPRGTDRVRALDLLVARHGWRLRPFLELLLQEGQSLAGLRAVHHLGDMGALESVPALLAALKASTGERARALVEALGKIGSQGALPALGACLGEKSLQDAVLKALARIGGPEAENILQKIQRALKGQPGEEARVRQIQEFLDPDWRKQDLRRRQRARLRYRK